MYNIQSFKLILERRFLALKLIVTVHTPNGTKIYTEELSGDEKDGEIEELASDIFFDHCYYEFEVTE